MFHTISLEVTIGALNSESAEPASWQPSNNYDVVGGRIIAYDATGAILDSDLHDEISCTWKVDGELVNTTDKPMEIFALNQLLSSQVFTPFEAKKDKTHVFNARHSSPSNGANNEEPITVKLLLHVVKKN